MLAEDQSRVSVMNKCGRDDPKQAQVAMGKCGVCRWRPRRRGAAQKVTSGRDQANNDKTGQGQTHSVKHICEEKGNRGAKEGQRPKQGKQREGHVPNLARTKNRASVMNGKTPPEHGTRQEHVCRRRATETRTTALDQVGVRSRRTTQSRTA